jgi:hypothetical protein
VWVYGFNLSVRHIQIADYTCRTVCCKCRKWWINAARSQTYYPERGRICTETVREGHSVPQRVYGISLNLSTVAKCIRRLSFLINVLVANDHMQVSRTFCYSQLRTVAIRSVRYLQVVNDLMQLPHLFRLSTLSVVI